MTTINESNESLEILSFEEGKVENVSQPSQVDQQIYTCKIAATNRPKDTKAVLKKYEDLMIKLGLDPKEALKPRPNWPPRFDANS